MVVQYAIDWDSIYSVWVMNRADEACDENILYDLWGFLRDMRRRISRNGLLFLDKPQNAIKGIVDLLKLIRQDDPESDPRRIAVWDKLRRELKEFKRLYDSSAYRVLVDCNANTSSYGEVQNAFDAYLKSTRLNRKKWRYPAVVISCSDALHDVEDGFRKVKPEEYDTCEEETLRAEWDEGCAISADGKEAVNKFASAISIAAGAAEDGRIELFDPNWSSRVLVSPPDSAWKASTRYWLEVVCCNPHVQEVRIVSSDVVEIKRRYTFGPFLDEMLLPNCRCRREHLVVDIGLREAEDKEKGRKVFHNRYIRCGRFVVEIPNGLDIVAENGSVRTFDCALIGHKCTVLEKLADPQCDSAIRRSNVKTVIADHEEFLFADDDGETFQFHIEDSKLVRFSGNDF